MGEPIADELAPLPYKDNRSRSVDNKRHKKDRVKYLGYRTVHSGQIGQPHYTVPNPYKNRGWFDFPADKEECTVTTMNKKRLFKEAQETRPYWYPRHHHACSDKKHKDYIRNAARHERAARQEARLWTDGGGQPALMSLKMDDIEYQQQAHDDAELAILHDIIYNQCTEVVDFVSTVFIAFPGLIDTALEKRKRRRRLAMRQLGWTDAADELEIGYPGDDWTDVVVDQYFDIDSVSEFELV